MQNLQNLRDGEDEDEETFLDKLFLHSKRFQGLGIHYLMFLIAACPSDHVKQVMGRSRLGLMDIHNFFNPYVFEVRDSAIVTIQPLLEVIGPGLNGMISSTFGDLERPDQGHLLKNRVPVRDSAIVTEEHLV